MATDFTSEVTQLYQDIQYTTPDTADLNTFVALLSSGQATVADVTSDIENAPFTVNVVDAVIREYQAAFGRVPDQAGVAFWVAAVAANPAALATLNVTFANSPEFATLYGGANANTLGMNNVALVAALYQNVLGRTPDQAGLNFWVSQDLTAAQLLQDFAQSPEFITDTAPAIIIYQNLEAAGTPPTTGSLFDLSPTTSVLTTGVDHVNGFTNVTGDLTPFFFNGIGPTLNTGDVISNVTTLTITDEFGTGNDVIPAGAQLSNITNVVLDTAGNAGNEGAAFSTIGITGVETLTINSAGAGIDFASAGPNTAIVDIQGNRGEFAGVEILGGSTVTVTSDGSGGVFIGTAPGGGVAPETTAQLPTGAVLVNDNGTGQFSEDAGFAQAVSVIGGTTVTVNVNSPTNGGDIDIGNTQFNTGNFTGPLAAATDPSGAITVTDAAQYGGDINEAVITIYGGTTVNVTGAGEEIVVGDPSVFNPANQPTGDVTITNTGEQIWSNTLGQDEDVFVSGGANVSVTTNTGSVFVGDYGATETGTPTLNAAGTAALAGTQPTGTVTILDTATNDFTSIDVFGGTSVIINGAHTVSAADIEVGAVVDGVVVAPTGNVTIFDNAATVWAGDDNFINDVTTDAGVGHQIDVVGGANVSITTNTASVQVGAFAPGAGPTGTVTIVDTATAEDNDGDSTELNGSGISDASVQVYGGTNVTVTASGIDVTIGADLGGGALFAPTGAVTVTNTATEFLPFDDILNTVNESVSVLGGTTVNVTTNAGDVSVGEDGQDNTGNVPTTGSEPSGAVTVTDNSVGFVQVYGGTNVTVSSAGGSVQIGDGANPLHSALSNPSGNVSVTMAAVETGGDFDTAVKVEGGVNVTVNTTGGDVLVGENFEQFFTGVVAGASATPVTGAVVVNDTFGGLASDGIGVEGGTTVAIAISASHDDSIDVGADPVQNTDGTALVNAADDPTGNVTITDDTVNGAVTTFGRENFGVVTNGGTTVSVTGGAGHNFIGDVQSTVLDATGLAAGTSHLTTVDLTGVNGVTTIESDALTTVSISDSRWFLGDIVNNTANSSLTVNLSDDANAHIRDDSGNGDLGGTFEGIAFIGTLVVNTTGDTPSVISLDLPGATSVTFNDTANLTLGDSFPGTNLDSVTTITVTGSGQTTLGDLTGTGLGLGELTTIDATSSTGGVLVEIDPGTAAPGTSFLGGSGVNIVALNADVTTADLTHVTIDGGGNAGDILYANFAAGGDDLPLGNNAVVSGFANLGVVGLADGTYNAEGFKGLVVGAFDPYAGSYVGVNGDITFTNVENGASLDLIDTDGPSSGITYQLGTPFTGAGGPLSITIGVDTTLLQPGTTGVQTEVNVAADIISSVTINSQGNNGILGIENANELALVGTNLTSVTITGDGNLDLATDGAVAVINASGSSGFVNVNDVALFTGFVPDVSAANSGGGVTVFGGTGTIEASGVLTDDVDATDTFNIGTGGGVIAVGAGGAGFNAGLGTNTGLETVNLTAAAPVGTSIAATDNVGGSGEGAFAIVNNWDLGVAGSGQTADSLFLEGTSPVVIANATNVTEADTAKYNISDGVISLAVGSAVPSSAQQLQDAQTIVDAAPDGTIAMVTVDVVTGPNTTGPATFLIEHNGGGGTADTFLEITGLTGSTGFGDIPIRNLPSFAGNIGAGTSLTLNGITAFDALFANVSANNGGATTASQTFTDTGLSLDTLTSSGVLGGDAVLTSTYASLGNFGILQSSNGGSVGMDGLSGNVTVTQVGVDPILTLSAVSETTINDLTYGNSAIAHDDPTLLLLTDGGSISVNEIIDASNTGTTLLISGAESVFVGGVSDTALATIDAQALVGELTLTANENGLAITGTIVSENIITAGGNNDVIGVGTGFFGPSDDQVAKITADGSNDHITVIGIDGGHDSSFIAASGAGDVITAADTHGTVYVTGNGENFEADNDAGSAVATQLGANDTINVGSAVFGGSDVHAWLGANSTVNLAGDSAVDLHLLGDTAGTGLTNMTVITGVGHGTEVELHFNDFSPTGAAVLLSEAWAAGNAGDSQVNVASVTTLAAALNLASTEALNDNHRLEGGDHTSVVNGNTTAAALTLNPGTGLLDWFQFGGNTYLVEAVNTTATPATHTGLASNDIVVELTGLVNVANHVDVHFGVNV